MKRLWWRLTIASALVGLASPAAARNAADDGLVRTASMMGAGKYAWGAADTLAGPVQIVVSLPLQQLFVYRGGALVAVSAVSTGRAGHETPTGSFKILQKAVTHHSSLYDSAPMPYMQRITWDGVAIHAGYDPGHADSHGCVRVPLAFARKLFDLTRLGGQVTIIADNAAPGLPVDYVRVIAPSHQDAVAAMAGATDPDADATRAANLGTQTKSVPVAAPVPATPAPVAAEVPAASAPADPPAAD